MVPVHTEGVWAYWLPLDASSQAKPLQFRVVLPLPAGGIIEATMKFFKLREDVIVGKFQSKWYATDSPRSSAILQPLRDNVVISKRPRRSITLAVS